MLSSEELIDTVQQGFKVLRPMLPTYLHLLVSALLPIYGGAHASLCRPSSAAKPRKFKKKTLGGNIVQDESENEVESRIEGLAASDAIWLPLFAGCTLGGLYIIIKWLEDPALLNTVLNWYFAIFGIYGVAKMFKDSLEVMVSCVFPSRYSFAHQIWVFDEAQRIAVSQTEPSRTKPSPLPGRLSQIWLPVSFSRFLWALRFPYSPFCIRADLHRRGRAHFHVTRITILSSCLALAIVLCYNLVSRPWYLTNILGFAFAYNALQFISPSTSSTGTLILGSLFLYDIYFVFYTPLMVTVATKLDIPAKLLFPRPSDSDSTKQQLSMLGLGDVVLPGMMIGFALRLDLYLHYLRKQTTKSLLGNDPTSPAFKEEVQGVPESDNSTPSSSSTTLSKDKQANLSTYAPASSAPGSLTIKSRFRPATGEWGTRFWTSASDPTIEGVLFSKPYFHSSLCGYVVGMIMTLGIMQVTGHAQPALFYLVPCVLGAFWGRALLRGELKEVWNFNEGEEKEEDAAKKEAKEAKVNKAEEVEADATKEGEEPNQAENEAEENPTGKKIAHNGSADRQSGIPKDKDFFELNLRIGFTTSKGLKDCRLSKKTVSKGRVEDSDASQDNPLALHSEDEEGQADGAQKTDLAETDSEKTESFELLGTEDGKEGDDNT
ncbi:MAG: hypothetical protein Q9172_006123 [Xanthocarpia lactea]